MADLLYFIQYFMMGFFLKQGDDLLDESNNERLAWITLGLSGILFGTMMTTTEWDLVLLASIITGVMVSGKVNRVPFVAGFVMIGGVLLICGLPVISNMLDFSALLFMLFMASVLDEKGNVWADRNASPRASTFFRYRFTLKVTVILLSIPWPAFLPSAVGLWFFDGGYEAAGWIFRRLVIDYPTD
ncbi:MAG: hypothetical protein ACTSV3_02345 [Candidatus Thorarchaeota archaeon]|nr:MAG: hypothetical protein DRP09_01320 [Candidatus Thorarchaeota archaeon]RLI58714.1 MAG: hypothetical protein DRO87_05010 [Candidatus Thorarchaeota archaeon]